MCIIFVATNMCPMPGDYKLIVASNRDEFYARPTKPLSVWNSSRSSSSSSVVVGDYIDTDEQLRVDSPFVLGGQDLEPGRVGGTWLAVGNRDGRVKLAALLNLTGEPKSPQALGRGFLCEDFIAGSLTAPEFCDRQREARVEYNAFNLVTVEIDGKNHAAIQSCSNAPPSSVRWPTGGGDGDDAAESRSASVAFGNSGAERPLAKVSAGRRKFDAICAQEFATRDAFVDGLMALLGDTTKCWPDAELARRAPLWGEDLSSICVRVPGDLYGTRTHSVILVDANDQLHYYERTMSTCDPDGEWQRTYITRKVELY